MEIGREIGSGFAGEKALVARFVPILSEAKKGRIAQEKRRSPVYLRVSSFC